MNSLTSKLEAEYHELASQYLDNLPIQSPEEFEIISSALEAIVNQNSYPDNISDSLLGRVQDIKELLSQPELFVEKPEHYAEYQKIIKTRIINKINEIRDMALTDQNHYISRQQERQALIVQMKEKMSLAKKPIENSEKHVSTQPESETTLESAMYLHRQALLQQILGLNEEEVIQLDSEQQRQWLMHRDAIRALLEINIPFREIISLNKTQFHLILKFIENVLGLLDVGVDFNQITSLEDEKLVLIFSQTENLKTLLQIGLRFDILPNLNPFLLQKLLTQIEFTKKLFKNGLNFNSLKVWDNDCLALLFNLPDATLKLLEKGEDLDILMTYNQQKLTFKLTLEAFSDLESKINIPSKVWISLSEKQITLIILKQEAFLALHNFGISLENHLMQLTPEKLELSLSYYKEIIALIIANVNFDTLASLEIDLLNNVVTCIEFILNYLNQGGDFDVFTTMKSKKLLVLGYFQKESTEKLLKLGVPLTTLINIKTKKLMLLDFVSEIIFDLLQNEKLKLTYDQIVSLSDEHIMRMYPNRLKNYADKLLAELYAEKSLSQAIDDVYQLYMNENRSVNLAENI